MLRRFDVITVNLGNVKMLQWEAFPDIARKESDGKIILHCPGL